MTTTNNTAERELLNTGYTMAESNPIAPISIAPILSTHIISTHILSTHIPSTYILRASILKKIMPVIFMLLTITITALTLPGATALPILPTEFYGSIKFYNGNGSAGVVIHAIAEDGHSCGNFTVRNAGYFGVLSCNGDWPSTDTDEGATHGQNITFTYNGAPTTQIGDSFWESGEFKRVDLIVPQLICGDGYCDSLERGICLIDCPASNQTPSNQTPGPGTDPGTGSGTGGGGSGGGGGGSGGAIQRPEAGRPEKEKCQENWLCTEWGECMINNMQNRTCIDQNSCGTEEDKPEEQQECIYIPTCFDGVMNGGETGIDCGGPCPPCPHCYDHVQNFGEIGIDCGGPCPPCPTCDDGKRNCHKFEGGVIICEDGIDCGGPCPPCKRFLEMPKLICVRVIDPFNIFFLMFVAGILFVLGYRITVSEIAVRQVKKNTKLDPVVRAQKYLGIRRRMYLFIISTLLISVILFLYYYFFGICLDINITYLWVLLLALIAVPFIVHWIMHYYEYNENKFLKSIRVLHDTHYRQIMQLIDIENQHLIELEDEIADHIRKMQNDPEFKEHLEKFPEIESIYKEILKLIEKYKTNKTPYAEEKILCSDIHRIAEKQEFKSLAEKQSELKYVLDKLLILYKSYEEKQALYDEIEKIEHPEAYEQFEEELGHAPKKAEDDEDNQGRDGEGKPEDNDGAG